MILLPQKTAEEPRDMTDFAMQFQQAMMLYEAGIRQLTTKLDILSREYDVTGRRSLITSVSSRIKSPQSIVSKLERRGYPVSVPSMTEHLNDIAGVRIICPYICDIYEVRSALAAQADVKLIRERDYIVNPKKSGYRSLHLVAELPVFLSESARMVRVEIQIRTMAMDFWASLEHQLRYKNEDGVPTGVADELKECAEVITQTDMRMERIARQLHAIDRPLRPSLSPV